MSDAKKKKSKGDEKEEAVNKKLNLRVFDLWALGITTVIGGQYFGWNDGLSAGFGSYLIATLLVGSSYICLCCCNAEITSALPFAGGAFGIARATLGLYPGYIVGCLAITEYIAYAAASCLVLSTLICDTTYTPHSYIPVYSLIFYGICLAIHISGGEAFWCSNAVLGVVSLAVLLMYNFGAIYGVNYVNFAEFSTTGEPDISSYFIGGIYSFLRVIPLPACFFVGVESLNLSCPFVSNVSTHGPS